MILQATAHRNHRIGPRLNRAFLRMCLVTLAVTGIASAAPQGNEFTYQGSLNDNGQAANGLYDFEFRLFDDANAGAQNGPMNAFGNIDVVGGLFTLELDFGSQFTGEQRWLEIAVRPAGIGAFTTLAPRQLLTSTPYALGLRLPFQGITNSNLGSAFEIVNNDMGWAGVFRNNNPANTDAALNVTSMGGPAGQFFNDAGGTTLVSRSIAAATAIYGDAPGGGNESKAIHGVISSVNGGLNTAAVRGENLSLTAGAAGVWGSNDGFGYGVRGQSLSGRGVFGEATADFGFGVYGTGAGRSGIGVYGIHPHTSGEYPGVDGVTNSSGTHAAGVRGRAIGTGGTPSNPASGLTYGVLGQSNSLDGVGVRGESNTGVEGEGQQYGVLGIANNIGGEGVRGEATYGVWGLGNDGGAGVTGEAGNGSTFGVWALGFGGQLSEPALRADNWNGPGIYALAGRAIEGEGTEFGIRGVTWEANGYGGTFTNYAAGGIALHTSGDAVIDGELTADVINIMGADVAERFPVSEEMKPGQVVEIDPENPGALRVARGAYNRRVAGVVSGAGDIPVGAILGNMPGSEDFPPIALSGRVWVQCDATAHAVEVGDLLTTAERCGYAMAVRDHARGFGSTIGKAMTGLAQGETGLVLVLVNLQ